MRRLSTTVTRARRFHRCLLAIPPEQNNSVGAIQQSPVLQEGRLFQTGRGREDVMTLMPQKHHARPRQRRERFVKARVCRRRGSV